MICLPDVEMPKNCHECDALGISDVVGLNCPCAMNRELYSYDNRPDECQLTELKLTQNGDNDLTMKCRDLIDYLKGFNPDQEIILFDENNRPRQIKNVIIDSSNDGYFNHINISHIEVS